MLHAPGHQHLDTFSTEYFHCLQLSLHADMAQHRSQTQAPFTQAH
jgi:hypothetical protein